MITRFWGRIFVCLQHSIRFPELKVYLETPNTVCPRSSVPFYVETYYIKWVTTFGQTVRQGHLCALGLPRKNDRSIKHIGGLP